ncbi:hypothetical protein HYT57_03585 [Candidatus Woesearchaeota archaeon]|nr:hypothetical protein [Candidatus Woesearchaeota archaeon]
MGDYSKEDLIFYNQLSKKWHQFIIFLNDYWIICNTISKKRLYDRVDDYRQLLMHRISLSDLNEFKDFLKTGIFNRRKRRLLSIILNRREITQTVIYAQRKFKRKNILSNPDLEFDYSHEAYQINNLAYNRFITSIKKYELDFDKWNQIKQVCEKKKMNIFQPTFTHVTKFNWTKKHLAEFPTKGLCPPRIIDRVGKGGFYGNNVPDYVSLFYNDDVKPRMYYEYANRVQFIIDRDYIKNEKKQFCFGYGDGGGDGHSRKMQEYIEEKWYNLGITHGRNITLWDNEIASQKPIPFKAIRAMIVPREKLGIIRDYILPICMKDPEYAIPIYDCDGNLMWPLD